MFKNNLLIINLLRSKIFELYAILSLCKEVKASLIIPYSIN
ncbi:hypothetical protein LDVICp118 [lymphocystis disease virus-China]|uniref:Uncharacterized protein n=1 Tax=lymphocystis disease virus-China TaxID=256729 RepID=Q677Z4_9VIRU|nr:hypothetical protein LDVICp118 [lymphocystis disease virus-China]AAU10963.1 hypothetical protein [lymphocystis disease virus-China]